jgi:hypothetical protein
MIASHRLRKQVVSRIFFNARHKCAGGKFSVQELPGRSDRLTSGGQGFDIVCIWLSTCFTPQVLRAISLASSA